MKKIFTVLFVILALSAWADLADSEIIVSSGTVNAGDSLTITVSTSELSVDWDVISFQFEMFYNPGSVTFSGFDDGDIFTDGLLMMNELEPGVIRAAYSHYEAEAGSGIIIRLHFHAIAGTSVLDIHDFKFNATAIQNLTNGSIEVIGGNQLPVADAGEDFEVDENAQAQLDGSASYDPEGSEITFLWSAPEGVILSDPTIVNPSFSAPAVDEPTELVFSLIVNDGEHDSFPDQVVVSVLNVNAPGDVPVFIDNLAFASISPNPFNPSTAINLLVPHNETSLKANIYSVKGQLIKSYSLTGLVPNSTQTIIWNGVDNSGNTVASGVYFCRIKGEHSSATKRMLLLK